MKLSICIPTYNRSYQVINQLNFLKDEILDYSKNIEIFVSDNNSNEEHQYKLLQYFERNKFFSYTKQESNLGLIGNVIYLLNQASNDFIWFVGDDDILEKGIINRIFHILQNNSDLKYIFFNHDAFKNNIQNVVKKHDLRVYNGVHDNGKDVILDLLFKYGTINMFITSCIYKTDLLKIEFLKTNRPHFIDDPLLFSIFCSTKGKIYIENEVFVHDNYTEISWGKIGRKLFAWSVPNRICETKKYGIRNRQIKKILANHYSIGRGNYFYFVLFSPIKVKLEIISILGFSNFSVAYHSFIYFFKKLIYSIHMK